MYRSAILLCTLFGFLSTAPQSSLEPIEIIADVKPTTYDMPFSVYDIPPSLPIEEPALINDDSLDSNLEDFPFAITTENAVELAKYADIATENYDAVTEIPFEGDYGTNMKDPKFYSKLGYFLRPHLIGDGLSDIGDTTTYFKERDNEGKEKVVNAEINMTRHGNSSYASDAFHSVDDDIKKDTNNSTSVANIPGSVENNLGKVENNLSTSEIKPSIDLNKRSRDDIENKSVAIENNSVEVEVNSIEIKPESVEIKSNKIGFQPSYINMRRKGNVARQISKSAKKKYRSKCRCEKIWNCPRLQITVPRCPNEYFMCCF